MITVTGGVGDIALVPSCWGDGTCDATAGTIVYSLTATPPAPPWQGVAGIAPLLRAPEPQPLAVPAPRRTARRGGETGLGLRGSWRRAA